MAQFAAGDAVLARGRAAVVVRQAPPNTAPGREDDEAVRHYEVEFEQSNPGDPVFVPEHELVLVRHAPAAPAPESEE